MATLPKTPGGCADRICKLKSQISAKKKEVKVLEDELSEIKEHTKKVYSKAKLKSCKGKNGTVSFNKDHTWHVKDWDKFYSYMSKNKAYDLMQKRVSDKAINDRLEEGEKVPGVEKFNFEKISITGLKK